MPELPSSNPKQFVQGAPVLHVSDVIATAAFYRDVLGFMWDFGDEAYAVVWRDNSAIHFVKDDANPKGIHLFQWVKDVDAYYRGSVLIFNCLYRTTGRLCSLFKETYQLSFTA